MKHFTRVINVIYNSFILGVALVCPFYFTYVHYVATGSNSLALSAVVVFGYIFAVVKIFRS